MDKIIRIYTLSDPRDGRVRYVGRTVNRLSRRLWQHIRVARRGKNVDKRKENWILDLLGGGMRPVIEQIDTATPHTFKTLEKYWIARMRDDYPDLLNCRAGGDGGMGTKATKWTPELEAQLGKISDARIAEQLGVHRKTVMYRREQLGIPAAFDRSRNVPPPPMGGHNKHKLPFGIEERLGQEPDYELAKRACVSKKAIASRRRELGIESFANATGSTGKFGTRPKPRKIELDDPKLSVLGTMTDKEAAALLHLSHSRTATIRNLLGIPSYRETKIGPFSPRTTD